MINVFLTQYDGAILGPIAKLLGFILQGIYSFFDMLFEKYGIRLYFTLFWDHENKTSKPENYVKLAIAYQYHPILCILVTITICILSISAMVRTRNEKGKKKMVILITSILMLVLSIIVTIGVIYMYKWEMEAECV